MSKQKRLTSWGRADRDRFQEENNDQNDQDDYVVRGLKAVQEDRRRWENSMLASRAATVGNGEAPKNAVLEESRIVPTVKEVMRRARSHVSYVSDVAEQNGTAYHPPSAHVLVSDWNASIFPAPEPRMVGSVLEDIAFWSDVGAAIAEDMTFQQLTALWRSLSCNAKLGRSENEYPDPGDLVLDVVHCIAASIDGICAGVLFRDPQLANDVAAYVRSIVPPKKCAEFRANPALAHLHLGTVAQLAVLREAMRRKRRGKSFSGTNEDLIWKEVSRNSKMNNPKYSHSRYSDDSHPLDREVDQHGWFAVSDADGIFGQVKRATGSDAAARLVRDAALPAFSNQPPPTAPSKTINDRVSQLGEVIASAARPIVNNVVRPSARAIGGVLSLGKSAAGAVGRGAGHGVGLLGRAAGMVGRGVGRAAGAVGGKFRDFGQFLRDVDEGMDDEDDEDDGYIARV